MRDIWAHDDLGVATRSLLVTVPAHGVRLLRMRPHMPAPPRPPAPPGPPPPHPPCPSGYNAHTAGYWHNLDFMMKASTVAACAAKCGKDCAAFEIFIGSGYPGDCYNFLANMTLPFTASESVTCVKV